jgi:peptidyl-prolyl cis-trans isomerase SurA
VKPRRPAARVVLGGLAVALAAVGLTGCRTDPNVAAYVGGEAISVRQLDDAVATRASTPEMGSYVAAHRDTYPRQVLGLLVTQQVYADAEQHFGVQVGDDAVRTELDQRLSGRDADQQYASAAAQGFSRQDVFETIRQQLVLLEIAHAQKLDDALSDASLRAAYQQQLPSLTQKQLGTIQTADQPTADAVVAQLDADPGAYGTVAAAHPGDYTTPSLQAVPAGQLPAQLADGVNRAAPNSAFSIAGPAGGVVVVFVGPTTTTSFEEARPQLAAAASSTVETAAQKVVDSYRSSLSVEVNPRYGVLGTNGQLGDPSGGAVQLLGDAAPSGAAAGTGTDPATPSGSAGG